MLREDGQMQLTHIYGLMQLEQQMIVGIMHQRTKMTHVQCQKSVTQQVCQKFRTNIILDVQHMYLERNYKIRKFPEAKSLERNRMQVGRTQYPKE